MWTPRELAEVLGAEDGDVRGRAVRGDRWRAPSSTVARCCSCLAIRPDRMGAVRSGSGRGCWRRGSSGSGRAGTTRWSRRGTGWRSARWPRPGCCSAGPTTCEAAQPGGLAARAVHLVDGGRLARTSRDGVAGRERRGARGLRLRRRRLPRAGRRRRGGRWVRLAGELLDRGARAVPVGAGGFFDTADDSEQLIYRPADPADGPTPSGTFAIAGALLSYSALTGSAPHREAAHGALGAVGRDRAQVSAGGRLGAGRRRGASSLARPRSRSSARLTTSGPGAARRRRVRRDARRGDRDGTRRRNRAAGRGWLPACSPRRRPDLRAVFRTAAGSWYASLGIRRAAISPDCRCHADRAPAAAFAAPNCGRRAVF